MVDHIINGFKCEDLGSSSCQVIISALLLLYFDKSAVSIFRFFIIVSSPSPHCLLWKYCSLDWTYPGQCVLLWMTELQPVFKGKILTVIFLFFLWNLYYPCKTCSIWRSVDNKVCLPVCRSFVIKDVKRKTYFIN